MLRRTCLKLLLPALFVAAFLMPAPAMAATNPFRGVDCGSAPDTAVCQATAADPLTGLLRKVTFLVATIAGAAAIIVIVLSGIRYITSGGDPEQVSKAKRSLIYAVVGLVIIVLGQSIINFVLR